MEIPGLIESGVLAEIDRELGQATKDYWKPTKDIFYRIWSDIIIPNATFFILATILILYLLYRYRYIQNKKINNPEEKKKLPVAHKDPRLNDLSDSIADDIVLSINQLPQHYTPNQGGYSDHILNPYQSKYLQTY